MWTHNIEANVKVDRFCLTLLGEARLWYETLNPDTIDWPTLKNAFRQQYSKLGHTPEQYFYQWRSFYFDENVDDFDLYVTRVSQCSMMLNYGEPQILKLMKNAIPSRLYPILFPIDNLRDAITTAKWVMTKQEIDRQKKGQSSATAFIQMNECGQATDRSSKRGVTFDAMETLERHCNSIDQVTSLVSTMNVKMDKKEAPYKPKVYQIKLRGQIRGRQQNFQPHKRSFSRDRNRTQGNYNYNNRNSRPNFRDRS